MRNFITTLFLFFALTANAQENSETIVTAEEFQSLSQGKTMYFSQNGFFFGAEQFYNRRRSLWQNNAKECLDGEWYVKEDFICFNYDLDTDPSCWHFFKKGGSFYARSEGTASKDFDIFMYNIDTKPLDCKGPDVGA
ncbi:MAG: hypothetical protein QNK92_05090 [Amylibacter sp.]